MSGSLGGGFQIANTDMTLRGVGNLLGSEQSGVANLVGFELYTKMLGQAVKNIRNEIGASIRDEVEIQISLKAHLPASFIGEEPERLAIYRRLFYIVDIESVKNLRESILDRYGEFPVEVDTLFKVALLKVLLSRIKAKKIFEIVPSCKYEIIFFPLLEKDIEIIKAFVLKNQKYYDLSSGFNLRITLADSSDNSNCMLDHLIGFVESLMIKMED